jgi:hypothetical protein
LGGIGALVQIIGAALFFRYLKQLTLKNKLVNVLVKLGLLALAIKLWLQFFSAFPAVAEIAYDVRNFIVAYLHLVLIGFISILTFAFILIKQPELCRSNFKQGLVVFVSTFILTQVMLVVQAALGMWLTRFPFFYEVIFVASIPLPLSIAAMLYSLIKDKRIAINLSS